MERPKILHYTHSFFPVYGGTSTRNYNLMRDENYQYIVYTPQAPCSYIPPTLGSLKEIEIQRNIEIHRIVITPDISDKIKSVQIFPYYIRYIIDVYGRAKKLYNAVNQRGFDIMYGHSPLEFGMASLWYAREKGIPLIYEAHSFLTDSLRESLLNNLEEKKMAPRLYRQLLFNFLNKYESEIIRKSDCIIAQTPSIKKKIENLFHVPEEKVQLIVNGVDCNMFDPKNGKDHNKFYTKRSGVSEFRILYSGFLNSINGVDFLLSAFKQLPRDKKPNLSLLIAGRGPMQQEVENISRVDPCIRYLGLVKYEDMPDLYNTCDLFVIPRPSVKDAEEFYPIKLIEAMAMEKPVLVSNVKAMAEIVNDTVTGFVFQKGSLDSFVSKLSSILKNTENLQAIGRAARRFVKINYSWENSQKKLSRKIEELLSNRK